MADSAPAGHDNKTDRTQDSANGLRLAEHRANGPLNYPTSCSYELNQKKNLTEGEKYALITRVNTRVITRVNTCGLGESRMFIGVAYYRHPTPPTKVWEDDLRKIKDSGITIVRAWAYWCLIEPQEDRFVWDNLDRLLELADKNDLQVTLQLGLEGPAFWLEEKYPELLHVDSRGNRVLFRATFFQNAVGGYPGLCLHNPDARKRAGKFIQKTVERYKENNSLFSWELWNEIWKFQPCYCRHSQDDFQQWLKKKYSKISNLNEVWQRSYLDFSEIRMPRDGQYADMIDLYEYCQNSAANNMSWRANTVREADRKHIVVAHHLSSCTEQFAMPYSGHCSPEWKLPDDFGQSMEMGDDDWLLAEPLDGWGVSCYETDYDRLSLRYTTTRCASRSKPWWDAEHAGGKAGRALGERNHTPAEARAMLFLALAHGAAGSIIWEWRPDAFGEEASNFGLTSPSGEKNPRTESVAQVCGILKRHKDVFENIRFENSQAAILWEPKSYIIDQLSYKGKGRDGFGFRNLYGYYRALARAGITADILNSREVAEGGIPEHIGLLICPYQIIDRENLADKMISWTRNGGVLLAGPMFGVYDSNTYASDHIPPEKVLPLFGAEQRDVHFPSDSDLTINFVNSEFIDSEVAFRAKHLIETLSIHEARALAAWNDEIVISENRFGKGKAILLGSFLGIEYLESGNNGIKNFISKICIRQNIVPRILVTGDALIRLAYLNESIIAFVFNPSYEERSYWLVSNNDNRKRSILSLIDEKDLGYMDPSNPINIKLNARDVGVYVMQ